MFASKTNNLENGATYSCIYNHKDRRIHTQREAWWDKTERKLYYMTSLLDLSLNTFKAFIYCAYKHDIFWASADVKPIPNVLVNVIS